jgi:hypothetical protein
MAAGRIQEFFGEDLEEALDSLKSAPGAVGNILVAAVRQIKLVDVLAFAVVVAGWLWVVFGYGVAEDHRAGLLVLSLLPAVLWLTIAPWRIGSRISSSLFSPRLGWSACGWRSTRAIGASTACLPGRISRGIQARNHQGSPSWGRRVAVWGKTVPARRSSPK